MTKAASQSTTGTGTEGEGTGNEGQNNEGQQQQGNQNQGNQVTTTTQQTTTAKKDDTTTQGAEGVQNKSEVDLTKISGDQLLKVLENPELFKTPRMKELLGAAKELKTLKEKQQADEEATLAEQKKFEELATKKTQEVEDLKKKLVETSINQSLANKLVNEKVIDLDGALKLIDRSKLSVDENGVVSGVQDAIESLKTEKSYLFNKSSENEGQQQNNNGGEKPKVGAASNTQNGNNQGAKISFKRSEIAAMSPADYQKNRTDILKAQAEGRIENDIQ